MNDKPRHPRSFWIVLGLLLVIGTGIGARVLTNGHDPTGDSPAPATASPDAIALGLVDCPKGVAVLAPVQTGRVVWVIDEGTTVKKEAVLLKLDPRPAQQQLALAQADLAASEEQLRKAQTALGAYQLKLDQQQTAIEAAQQQLAQAKANYETAKYTFDKGTLSKEDLIVAEAARTSADLKVKSENQKKEELQRLLKPILQGDVRKAKADRKAKEAQVESAKLAMEETEVKAPADGLVLRVQVSVGEILITTPKAPPIQFCAQEDPRKDRIIRAEVLQEWADRVKPDQEVVIENDPRSKAQWRGKVKSISNWFAPKRNIMLEPFIANDVRTLECIIEVTSDNNTLLRIGQRVRVIFPSANP